ncbi:hypothetical protein [Geminocystis sp. NIES-3709]|uniref:hypothetical protein n=1 Tax=Geminocystis sp. NIES-3709 TaxID=1617448 RepID=UPI0005FCBA03|nr:hypothetical protein [Geminocystis sp. NIES-3709]BAQ64897.1 hypothetical protein GM3709_1662 [Geminocystis sp. NIES-3709]
MAINRFQNWSKRTQRMQKESLNSSSVWDNSIEEEQENIEQVKRQWQEKQHREFQRIQYEESQNRKIKLMISTLVSITLIAIAFPHIPYWWENTKNTIAELFPEETPKTSSKKGGFLDKLKKLQEKQSNQENNKQDNLTEDNTDKQKKGSKATIGEQLEESVDNIEDHNKNFQKAIDLSDGKEVNLQEEK